MKNIYSAVSLVIDEQEIQLESCSLKVENVFDSLNQPIGSENHNYLTITTSTRAFFLQWLATLEASKQGVLRYYGAGDAVLREVELTGMVIKRYEERLEAVGRAGQQEIEFRIRACTYRRAA